MKITKATSVRNLSSAHHLTKKQSMGNQHPQVLQWNEIQARRRAELMETYGMAASEEKVILREEIFSQTQQHGEERKEVVTIVYPIDDQKGREFYNGELEGGKRHGKGFLLWKNGVTYEGEWQEDSIEGAWGTMTWPDDRSYTGGWKKGVMDGVGVMIFKSPEHGELRYEGEWKAGQRDGKGKQTFGERDASHRVSYEGEWVAGKREGHGVMLWEDGSIYIGQWENGRREGYGVYFDPIIGEKYIGQWKDDKQEDPEARVVDKNGNEYRGPFVDGVKHGNGVFRFKHGREVAECWASGEKLQCPTPQVKPSNFFAAMKKKDVVGGSGVGVDGVVRVQSLMVLCIEAVGTNPKLLKKLGIKKKKKANNVMTSSNAKTLLVQSKKVAILAWQATGPKDNRTGQKKAPATLYSALKNANPSSVELNSRKRSMDSSVAVNLLPTDVLECLEYFLNSREAIKLVRREQKMYKKRCN